MNQWAIFSIKAFLIILHHDQNDKMTGSAFRGYNKYKSGGKGS